MYHTFRIVYSMTLGSGCDAFVEVVNEGSTPSPPISNADDRMTAILEQLVRSNEAQVAMQAHHRKQMAKSHEAQMGMQALIASCYKYKARCRLNCRHHRYHQSNNLLMLGHRWWCSQRRKILMSCTSSSGKEGPLNSMALKMS